MGLDLRDTLSKDADEIETEGERSHCSLELFPWAEEHHLLVMGNRG